MRIDPVYLLAPAKKPPSMPTRRAFLLAGTAFLGGSALGGACGYSMGARTAGEGPVGAVQPVAAELEKTGNFELDELRRLAVKAPLDELFEKAIMFLTVQGRDYPSDSVLWRGIDRLSQEMLANPKRQVDRAVILVTMQTIQYYASPESLQLRERIKPLKERAAAAQRR